MVEIDIQKLNFSYDKNEKLFKDFNLLLKDYNSYSLIGPSGVGKSTLINCINESLKYNGKIKIFDSKNSNNNVIISTIKENDTFYKKTLYKELQETLKIRGFDKSDCQFLIDEVVNFFDIKELIDKDFSIMTYSELAISNILVKTIIKPDLILIDDVFKLLNKSFKKRYLQYLANRNITLINIISNMNDALYTEYIVVLLKEGKIAIEGTTMGVLKEEKLLKRIGLELPFMIDLSLQLNCYDLLDKIYLNKIEMVRNLWK